MATKRIIAICQSGGEFETDKDGLLSYKGGDAHAMEIDDKMKYTDFKLEIAEMFTFVPESMSIKYFLPTNKKTLISISNDKDLKFMRKVHGDSATAEIYVMTEEIDPPEVSNMPGSRSSRTTLSEPGILDDPPPAVMDDVIDDINQPNLMLDANFDIVGDTNNNNINMDMSSDIPVPISFIESNDQKLVKSAEQWQNIISGVGQRFNSVHEFREALRKYAIASQFGFKYKKNDSHRVTVKCKAENCPWRIHASRLSTTQLICIKKMNPTHTCEGTSVTNGSQATRSWVAGVIKEKLKVFPNYKPKDIVTDIKEEYGVQLNYFQAWRGKEIAKEQLQGSYKDAYRQLPVFCEKIMETNPGSFATFSTKDDSSFQRFFVSFRASIQGFKLGCRPLLFLDSIFLKSKYQGTLLAATAPDANDEVFPVAFAIVDSESDENWNWFLVQLKIALVKFEGVTIISDREKGLKESISEVFEEGEVYHGFCLRYLSEQLMRDLKSQLSNEAKRLLIEDLYSAAYATNTETFQRFLDSMKGISLEAYNWVMQTEPEHWSNAFFRGLRYNHMMCNFGELFYSWVTDAHELPITQMVDVLRGKIMDLIFERRNESNQWLTRLTPVMEDKLEKESLKVRSLQVLISANNKFEVRGETIDLVDVENYDCSCKVWQITGLPCSHAVAVIGCLGRDVYEYCGQQFSVESYRLTYSDTIHPVPSIEKGESRRSGGGGGGGQGFPVTVTPPPTRRPPGRPASTKKMSSQEAAKRQLQCSRCKSAGHNKSTCKEFLLEG